MWVINLVEMQQFDVANLQTVLLKCFGFSDVSVYLAVGRLARAAKRYI